MEAEAGLKQARNGDAGGRGSGYVSLPGEAWDQYRRRRGRQAPPGAAGDAFGRNWRVSAAAAGLLLASMALTGVVALFSTIQRARAPMGQTSEAVAVARATVAPVPSSARETGERRDRGGQA